MNLERSIDSLVKRFDKLYPETDFNNKTGLSRWKGKPIIPLDEWIEIRNTSYTLNYFPDDFNQDLIYILQGELSEERKLEDVKKWDSDYQELMEHTKNPKYGRLKCFHCILSPDGDDPIFIGINRLVAKGLTKHEHGIDSIQYPCRVVNRFQCPYDRTNMKNDSNNDATNPPFETEDLFRLQQMAFVVELALAKARKDDAETRIKDKQDLLDILTDRYTFIKLLRQADDTLRGIDYLDVSSVPDNDCIADYFIKIESKINQEELRFY